MPHPQNTRPRGVTVYPMPEAIGGPFDTYALALRNTDEHTEARMVHTQGVAYLVTDEKPWTWNDYAPDCPVYTVADLIAATDDTTGVDLADWVDTFGARLESNFGQVHHWATS